MLPGDGGGLTFGKDSLHNLGMVPNVWFVEVFFIYCVKSVVL